MLSLINNSNFMDVFYALDFKSRYRKPKSILKYLKRYKIKSGSEIVYIGDSDVDFETASNIGADCFLLNTGLNIPKHDHMYTSFKDIIEELKKTITND